MIRNGTIVDGTGGERYRADIGIDGGRIVRIGNFDAPGRVEIDAERRCVAPGFIDIHTHYDAQVVWDKSLSPSPLHGVTTVIGGNCGFSLAPVSDDTGDYVSQMLSRVEGVPLEALREGLDWNWRSFGSWLDRIDDGPAVNVGFLTGHSTLRRLVMGAGSQERSAVATEIRQMADLLRDSLLAGSLGFSSSYSAHHKDHHGRPVPSRYAKPDELIELAKVAGEFPGTTLEFGPELTPRFPDATKNVMASMSAAANRALTWTLLMARADDPESVEDQLSTADYARERGGRVVPLTLPMALDMRLNFVSGYVLDELPGWQEILLLDPEEKLALLRAPAVRARMKAAVAEAGSPWWANWEATTVNDVGDAQLGGLVGVRVGDIADREGRSAFDVMLDLVVESELEIGFGAPIADSAEDHRLRAELVADPRIALGGGDAGAHLDMISSFNYPTTLLSQVADGTLEIRIEDAVRLLTQVPAQLYGLTERGRISEGWHADLVVFDPEGVRPNAVAPVSDLPGGSTRLFGGARGIEHVLVNGVEVVGDDSLTGAAGGRVLRSGADTHTVEVN